MITMERYGHALHLMMQRPLASILASMTLKKMATFRLVRLKIAIMHQVSYQSARVYYFPVHPLVHQLHHLLVYQLRCLLLVFLLLMHPLRAQSMSLLLVHLHSHIQLINLLPLAIQLLNLLPQVYSSMQLIIHLLPLLYP